MSAWNQLGKRIGNIAQSASQKSGKMVETAKLNAEVNRLEGDIEDIQYELGKAYYEKYFLDEECEFADHIQRINQIVAKIQACNTKLLAYKDLQVCPNCHSTEPLGNEFCGKCGARLTSEKSSKYCPNCGAEISEADVYCPDCGCSLALEEGQGEDDQ